MDDVNRHLKAGPKAQKGACVLGDVRLKKGEVEFYDLGLFEGEITRGKAGYSVASLTCHGVCTGQEPYQVQKDAKSGCLVIRRDDS